MWKCKWESERERGRGRVEKERRKRKIHFYIFFEGHYATNVFFFCLSELIHNSPFAPNTASLSRLPINASNLSRLSINISGRDEHLVYTSCSSNSYAPRYNGVKCDWKIYSVKIDVLHQDNVYPHVSHSTLAYLEENEIQLIPHSPYIPDLALCNFYLFPNVKKKLNSCHFVSRKEIINATQGILIKMVEKGFSHVFQQ